MRKIQPVILAGGTGKRLAPLSTPEKPKQFHALSGKDPLLAQTLKRLQDDIFRPALIVGAHNHAEQIIDNIRISECPDTHIMLETTPNGTACAIATAALWAQDKILKTAPETTLLICPSDHFIGDNKTFINAVKNADTQIETPLHLFGKPPETANTQYGYIQFDPATGPIYKVTGFTEKPDLQTAQHYADSQDYLWNTGIFLFNPIAILEAVKAHQPRIWEYARDIYHNKDGAYLGQGKQTPPSISIDSGVLEHMNRLTVSKLNTEWHDLGTWDNLKAAQNAISQK